MLDSIRKITNMVSNSKIDNTNVVQFRATVTEAGKANITKNIKDTELYLTNQEQCEKDYEEFEAEVLKIANL